MRACQLHKLMGYQQTAGIIPERASVNFATRKDASLGVQDLDFIGVCKLIKECAEGRSKEKQREGVRRKGYKRGQLCVK